ncbi:MAG: hypothetical protein AB7H86_12110 [Blastocatellales bacterium]
MATRTDNECAWCAEVIPAGGELIGVDWKVYCSDPCRVSGEQASEIQYRSIMRHVQTSRKSRPDQPNS